MDQDYQEAMVDHTVKTTMVGFHHQKTMVVMERSAVVVELE